jgi:hypothetical protein
VIIVSIVASIGSLTLTSYYLPSLTPFSQWFLAITPLAVAFATFYLSVSITRDRQARQMAERIYTPLFNEARTWLDPHGQSFSEWTRINKEAPYWVRRIPKELTKVLNDAYNISQNFYTSRAVLYRLVPKGIEKLSSEIVPKAGFIVDDTPTVTQFVMLSPGYGEIYIDPALIWQMNQSVSKYIDDRARESYLPGSNWELQTRVSRSGVPVKVAGGTEDATKWLERVMEFLATQPSALEFRKQIQKIRTLGEEALLLIEEELG